jgi:hypothetical protein
VRHFEQFVSFCYRVDVDIFQFLKGGLEIGDFDLAVGVICWCWLLTFQPQLLDDPILLLDVAGQLVYLSLEVDDKLLVFGVSAVTGIFLGLADLGPQLLNCMVSVSDLSTFFLDELVEPFELGRQQGNFILILGQVSDSTSVLIDVLAKLSFEGPDL